MPDRIDIAESMVAAFRRGSAVLESKIELLQNEADNLARLTAAHSPLPAVDNQTQLVDQLFSRAKNGAENIVDRCTAQAQELFSKVEALNPVAVLNRGFAYLTKDEKDVRSVIDVNKGDILDITLKDGVIRAEVLE